MGWPCCRCPSYARSGRLKLKEIIEGRGGPLLGGSNVSSCLEGVPERPMSLEVLSVMFRLLSLLLS